MPKALKILFVDDEPDLAPLIRQKFRRNVREGDLALDFAGDGVEALEKLELDPDIEVVVTDLNMPRMDGLTLLGRLGDLNRRMRAVVVTAYGDMENIRTAMNRGAFDFLTKPIDMADLEITIGQARKAVEREREADLVRTAFGRYLSDEIAHVLLSTPGTFSLGGEKRVVSVLMSDLSGFSQLAERLDPERVVDLLNIYLGAMTEVVDQYGGAIDEFIGDAVLVIFGAPIERADHAHQAAACAVAMQRAMQAVNGRLAELGLPPMEMTVAVNTGEVVVGNIGSEKRAKYGVVGSPVNLTARIQTLAAPGEVLISEATRVAAGDGVVEVGETREVSVKGFAHPIAVHSVAGVEAPGGGGPIVLPDDTDTFRELTTPVGVSFTVLDGKRMADEAQTGRLVAVSDMGALVDTEAALAPRSDLRLSLDLPGADGAADIYGKVVETVSRDGGGPALRLRFSSLPPDAAAALARLA